MFAGTNKSITAASYNLFNYIFTFIFVQCFYIPLCNLLNWFISAQNIICSVPTKLDFNLKFHAITRIHWNRKSITSNCWTLDLVERYPASFNLKLRRCGVAVITAVQLHPTKPELRFCAGSNPTRSVSEICDREDLWEIVAAGNKAKCFLGFRRSTIPQKQFINHICTKKQW